MRLPWSKLKKNGIVDDLIAYVDRNVVPLSLSSLRAELGPMELRYACVRLLTWLHSQTDLGGASVPPLKIDRKYQWCNNLLRILEEFQDLGRHFDVKSGELIWQDDIPFEDQLAIAKQVHRSWKGMYVK
jgi:hypothetical protein